MRAVVWDGTAITVSDRVELRDPADDEVVVEVAAVGLCHSDLNPVRGSYRQAVPAVLGHEAVGRVVATGRAAAHLAGGAVSCSRRSRRAAPAGAAPRALPRRACHRHRRDRRRSRWTVSRSTSSSASACSPSARSWPPAR